MSCGISKKESKSELRKEKEGKSEEKLPEKLAEKLQTEMKEVSGDSTFTVIMIPEGDVQQSIETLLSGGGKLIYDPNNRASSTIPFYIAKLTPDQINNVDFIKNLNLKEASIDNPKRFSIKPINGINSVEDEKVDFSKFIPTDDVKLSELGEHKTLGKGITVAVLDAGVDASHPALKDRVVYWYDATERIRVELKKYTVSNDSVQVDGLKESVVLPDALKGEAEVFTALVDESAIKDSLATIDLKGDKKSYYDLNRNGSSDKFLVFLKKSDDGNQIYFDLNGDQKFEGASENTAKIDYNETTRENRSEGMVKFASRNNIIEYPLLLTEDGDKSYIGFGKISSSHGTHVAGIIAANDPKNGLLGAAPEANIMSIKICNSGGCPQAAMLKGLVKAFYNGKYIPDVVNMSIGSLEQDYREAFSLVLSDLSAKFGTTFFISSSNNGAGFRTHNHVGDSGPIISVGAGVSKSTYQSQYNFPENGEMKEFRLLHFSSLGPSYTSEMKPNIVAPGASISSVEAASGYMSHMNGTSMSSPLAAGTFAAVLSNVRSKDPSLFTKIDEVRKSKVAGEDVSSATLLPYAYAMRDAVQSAALNLSNLTRVQQGYGLIQAGATEKLVAQYLKELNEGARDYFEVVINDYKPSYSRNIEAKKAQAFKLSIGLDGERPKQSLAKIISGEVKVVLKRVEIISQDGNVETYTGDEATKYFYLYKRGDEKTKSLETKVAFNNDRNSQFNSVRALENMVDGKTYLAQYQVLYLGNVMTDIIDVVHRPIVLKKVSGETSTLPDLEGLDRGFIKDKVSIDVSESHRYPIAVDSSMTKLIVKLDIHQGEQGVLYLNVYNPNGATVKETAAVRADIFKLMQGVIEVPLNDLKEKDKLGIWEVTVSAGSSNAPKANIYDLVMKAEDFGFSAPFKMGKARSLNLLPVRVADDQVEDIKLLRVEELTDVKVDIKSTYTSYTPLPIAADFKGEISVKVDPTDKGAAESLWAALYPDLFIKKDGEFIKCDKCKLLESSDLSSVYEVKEAMSEQLYFAVLTKQNFDSTANGLKSGGLESVNFKVGQKLQDESLLEKIQLDFENLAGTSTGVLKLDLQNLDKENLEFKVGVLGKSGRESNMKVLVID